MEIRYSYERVLNYYVIFKVTETPMPNYSIKFEEISRVKSREQAINKIKELENEKN